MTNASQEPLSAILGLPISAIVLAESLPRYRLAKDPITYKQLGTGCSGIGREEKAETTTAPRAA